MNPQNIFAQRAGMMPAAPPPGMPLSGVQPGVLPARNPGMLPAGMVAPGAMAPMAGVRPAPVMQQQPMPVPQPNPAMVAAAGARPAMPQNALAQRAMMAY